MEIIEACGHRYKVDLSVDMVLRAMEISKDWMPADITARYICWWMVFGWVRNEDALEIVNAIFKSIEQESTGEQKTMDIQQDWGAIRAGFMQSYGIDIEKEKCRMSWRDFIVLLEYMPGNTRLAEIIDIRTREIPELNKYNAKEIQALVRAKNRVRLKDEGEGNFKAGLAGFFEMMKGMADRHG
jgi:hypothetical protein